MMGIVTHIAISIATYIIILVLREVIEIVMYATFLLILILIWLILKSRGRIKWSWLCSIKGKWKKRMRELDNRSREG